MITQLVHIGLTGAFLMLPPAATLQVGDPHHRSLSLPYGSPTSILEPVPEGYEPVFVESVGRHGSRGLSSPSHVDHALTLWQEASSSGALTPLGETFGPEVRELDRDNRAMGYGELSTLGAAEQSGIGRRTAQRLPGLLDGNARVEIRTSGASRATASGKSFAEGLAVESPELEIDEPTVDLEHLQFDLEPGFRAFLHTDRLTDEAIADVADSPAVVRAAASMLGRLYTSSFVRQIDDPIDAAYAIFGLYAIGPAMRNETETDFEPYVSQGEAAAFAWLSDARYFFERGPGITGRDDSFAPASVLLEDFFDAIDKRLAGDDAAAVFRFGHAEQIIPLAALLELPGSDRQAPRGETLTRADNPWRGGEVSRMAANIQWIVYDHETEEPLVAMLYNEHQIPFKADCRAIADDSYLFRLDELRRCLR